MRYSCVLGCKLALVAGFIGIAADLSAQTIESYVMSFGAADLSVGPTSGTVGIGKTFSLTFDRFDPALGTLTAVNVNYSFSFAGTGHTGPSAGSGSYSIGGAFYLDGAFLTGNGTGGGFGGPPNITQPMSSSLSGDLGPDGTGSISAGMITGTGQSVLSWTASGSLNASGGAIAELALGTSVLEVIYTYTPIPEPSTGALASGAVCLALATGARRRRPPRT